MSKQILAVILVAASLVFLHLANAQQPKKVSRLGYLSSQDLATESARSKGIRLALRELGYIEGQNIAIEPRLRGHVCRFLISQRQRLPGHLLSSTGESVTAKSCMNSLTSSISSIRLSISKERERAGSWMSPWRAQARYFSASFSQVRGFFG